jgi:hypothetical protein
MILSQEIPGKWQLSDSSQIIESGHRAEKLHIQNDLPTETPH